MALLKHICNVNNLDTHRIKLKMFTWYLHLLHIGRNGYVV